MVNNWKSEKIPGASGDIYSWNKNGKYLVISDIQGAYIIGLVDEADNYSELKSYKTKKSALKYTKEYMRKH